MIAGRLEIRDDQDDDPDRQHGGAAQSELAPFIALSHLDQIVRRTEPDQGEKRRRR